ncbi:Transposase zinc-ribbon domain-containing protein [Paenibacillus sp. UNCCL117]|uniref:transposase n=1 Tax=unclassified Paenibacillus TaxID=185978 RepID=UPI0008814C22|nr:MULTISPECIES: transposase [unclassified Paenibacillus]SDC09945.1 Transposase zinc-ribbon domain-containing protein [Paenibacillus sp. cl123]SFW16271.1 Transposase zinc-ribbon domain-containing protein [Paenibacillus sp. UNCCL117]
MEASPITFEQFNAQYANKSACENTLYKAKWPNGFTCSVCGHRHAYQIRTRRLPLFECSRCCFQESLISGTVMEGSKTALVKWFQAIFLLSHDSYRINARQLSSIIDVTYKTAWLMLHKLRHAMTLDNNKELLTGIIRVNIGNYGRPRFSSSLEHPRKQTLLIGADIDEQGSPVHLKIKKVPAAHMHGDSILRSGTKHFSQNYISPQHSEAHFVTRPYCSRRFQPLCALNRKLGNWINQTFHGIGPKHLQSYLEEFAYRYKLSSLARPFFSSLLQLAASSPRTTYRRIIQSEFI